MEWECLCAGTHELSFNTRCALRASRPQLKRDPLGRSTRLSVLVELRWTSFDSLLRSYQLWESPRSRSLKLLVSSPLDESCRRMSPRGLRSWNGMFTRSNRNWRKHRSDWISQSVCSAQYGKSGGLGTDEQVPIALSNKRLKLAARVE